MSNQTIIDCGKIKTVSELGKRPSSSLTVVMCVPVDVTWLEGIAPHVDEVVVTSIDCSEKEREKICRDVKGSAILRKKVTDVIAVNPTNYPELYLIDLEETFQTGEPFRDEVYTGPFTKQPFLADLASVLNLGWSQCSQEWRLTVMDNEIFSSPEEIAGVLFLLESRRRDAGHLSVARIPGSTHYPTRIARRLPAIRWEGAARPVLDGSLYPAVLDGNLKVLTRDGRNPLQSDRDVFRSLYAEARKKDWNVPSASLLHMARTAEAAGLPDFAAPAIEAYLEASLYTEERAWACALRGEISEKRKDYADASSWYERSLEEHPGWKAALRLSRSKFSAGHWQECINAYARAMEHKDHFHVVDDGKEEFASSLIPLAVSLHQLGRRKEASKIAKDLLTLYPESKSIAMLCQQIG